MQEYNQEDKGSNQDNEFNKEKDFNNNDNFSSLSKGHKFAVFGLILFSVFFVYMWSVQFKNSLKNPLSVNLNNNINNDSENLNCSGGECNNDSLLKNKDTDGDGFNDYDEMYIYNTSPYLEDTDGDGFNDYDEIKAGTDPNCPEGRECYASNEEDVLDDSDNDGERGDSKENSPILLEGLEGDDEGYKDVLSGEGDANTIRDMLIEAGMDKDLLNQISDEDLLRSYKETLGL
jgi:hypothetical protein